MHSVVTESNQILTKDLTNPSLATGSAGRIVITAEEITDEANREMVFFSPVA